MVLNDQWFSTKSIKICLNSKYQKDPFKAYKILKNVIFSIYLYVQISHIVHITVLPDIVLLSQQFAIKLQKYIKLQIK